MFGRRFFGKRFFGGHYFGPRGIVRWVGDLYPTTIAVARIIRSVSVSAIKRTLAFDED